VTPPPHLPHTHPPPSSSGAVAVAITLRATHPFPTTPHLPAHTQARTMPSTTKFCSMRRRAVACRFHWAAPWATCVAREARCMLTLSDASHLASLVLASDGHVYDAMELQRWLDRCARTGRAPEVVPSLPISRVQAARCVTAISLLWDTYGTVCKWTYLGRARVRQCARASRTLGRIIGTGVARRTRAWTRRCAMWCRLATAPPARNAYTQTRVQIVEPAHASSSSAGRFRRCRPLRRSETSAFEAYCPRPSPKKMCAQDLTKHAHNPHTFSSAL
jgi:hypothetical protein